DRLLVDALAPLLRAGRLRLIVAPHEPSAAHLDELEATLAHAGIVAVRLSGLEAAGFASDAPVVVVDRTGVLADLYVIASWAYVGGGFGNAGLHSVVEPAAIGVPTAFGPRVGNALEAVELAATGGGVVVDSVEALRA